MSSDSDNKSLSASLSELKDALKDSTEPSDDANTISSAYKKSHADNNIEIARRNLKRDPTNPMLKDWLAFNLYASGLYEEAAGLYEECISLDASNADQHYYLGSCYYKLGSIKRAIVEWERVIEIDRHTKCAQKAIAKLARVNPETS